MNFKDYLKDATEKYGISLSDEQLDQFDKYYQLLVEWNEKINQPANRTVNQPYALWPLPLAQ